MSVLNHLQSNDLGEIASFCYVPPIVTVQRRIQIITQTLYN